eukprot:TRINITY_DN35304_c0_g1_i1.p2 TRINITY_DN35304_c0_g1~~TRINITY_DN35304_c0_g1_i1.p2  ORF type:complete len:151 (+),score=3.98 TRINITY_DN35304_c0_g1_i1:27-455(+)
MDEVGSSTKNRYPMDNICSNTSTLDLQVRQPSWEQFLLLEEVPLDFEEVQLFDMQQPNIKCTISQENQLQFQLETIGSNLVGDFMFQKNFSDSSFGEVNTTQSFCQVPVQVFSSNIEEGCKSSGSRDPSVGQREGNVSAGHS